LHLRLPHWALPSGAWRPLNLKIYIKFSLKNHHKNYLNELKKCI